MKRVRQSIRNVAIIAHVDHGKTTLVDKLLQQSGTLDSDKVTDRVMDSNDLERERGITILAKNTGITYKDHQINIVDTPGHADFGGEVERTLQMVEGFLLLVDAAEGVLPGTRFVLQKALALNLKPIVFINKVDRKDADIERTESLVHDLFLDLVTHESQLDFPILYGSGRLGFATTDPKNPTDSMETMLDAILKYIPAPVEQNETGLQLLVTNIDHSDFLGTIAVGRVLSGTFNLGDQFVYCYKDIVSKPMKVTKLYTFHGLGKVEVPTVTFGDIVALAGCEEIEIGSTLCSPDNPIPCQYVAIDEPTVSLYISVNNSPFNGQEGKLLTSRHIKERLEKEIKTNVALRVEPTESAETFKVSGRGQLHLGILIETMRREGFEMQISAPEVILKTIDGKKCEPIEYVFIDVEDQYQGSIIEHLGTRRGELRNVQNFDSSNRVRLEFTVPARGLLGFRNQFLTNTRGTGIMNSTFHGYEPYKGEIPSRTRGALISMEQGSTTGYALDALQPRGELFVGPGEQVYEGMVIGEHSRDNDLDVNPCKGKKLTNMRASGTDDAIKLAPPRPMPLEVCMEWINNDELIEVTPKSIRLRKKILKAGMRKKR
ncbi:MAG: translational GTPase TypA [Proteobacteria bacterium]|nr:translational GTPase TypA [Pseudomonadota bacterium]